MPNVEYACEGRLLFRTETTEDVQFVPRIHEVVVIDDAPYQVVDVEYWAKRRLAPRPPARLPDVYVIPVSAAEWEQRLERRAPRAREGKPPVRY
jgi:hypothetical protein